jgi:hypothetical protein
MSRAYTPEEIREQFVEKYRFLSAYWAKQPCKTEQERCDRLASALLEIFDGVSGDLPPFAITPTPRPDDKDFLIENGQNYFTPSGLPINTDCLLYQMYDRAAAT